MADSIKKTNVIKYKLINRIMSSGRKKISENLLLKSFKKIQKNSKKQSKKIVQLSLINFMPLFKFNEILNKKSKKKKVRTIPSFLAKTKSRTFLSIKFLTENLNKKLNNSFYKEFSQKIITIAQNTKFLSNNKSESLKKLAVNKRYLKYYRW